MSTFTADRLLFGEQVSRVLSVVPGGSDFQPVLRNIQVSYQPGSLRLAATDLDLSKIVTGGVTTEDTGTVLLPAQRLASILREASSKDVTVTVEGLVATISAGSASWELHLDSSSYVALPDVSTEFQNTSREALARALRVVRHAVSSDTANPGLGFITVTREGDGTARVTACDSSRFQQARLPGGFPLAVQIPAMGSPSAADELLRTLTNNEDISEIGVAETDAWLMFRVGSGVFVTRKVSTRPSDTTKLLTSALTNNQLLEVDRAALADAVRRVRITADASTSAIGLLLAPGEVTVVSRDLAKNKAEEQIAAKWEGKERTVVLHHRHLSEMLAVYPGDTARFFLGADARKRRSTVLLKDGKSEVVGIVCQLPGRHLGYE